MNKKEKNFVRVDEWVPTEKQNIIRYDGKLIIIPLDKILNQKGKGLNTFVIQRELYTNLLDHITKYLNYFLEFYDKEDKELILSYVKLKYMIDMKKKKFKTKEFIEMLYTILFTDSLCAKIERMVEDNYYIDIKSNDKKKYVESLEFTVEQAKTMMKISIAMKIMVPILFHYINMYNLGKTTQLYIFYEPLFYMFDKHIDIYNKLYTTVNARIKRNFSRNKRMWKHREIMGIDPLLYIDDILQTKIISESMFKYRFDDNIIGFNSVIIENQLVFFLKNKYTHTPIELRNEKDVDGLSGLDKLEMNSAKIDESLVVISSINVIHTIKRIERSMNIELDKDEIKYYDKRHKVNKFQSQLVYYFYAKEFSGYRDLNMLTRAQYMKLLVLLKRRLQIYGFVYLPQILTANIERLNRRTIQNSKFLAKVESSDAYKRLINEKFSTLEELGKEKTIINIISSCINSTFSIVDYDNEDKLGEPLEILNNDIVSDEVLNYLNQI